MSPLFDLHSHSTASDGTLTPQALVRRARERGVDVLALTDHDTTAGLAEAAQAAAETGLTLVPGVEISVTWLGQTIHILGLHIDPDNATLQAGLRSLCEFREWRAREIAARLTKAGVLDSYAGARAHARGQLVSRTHFAHFLVERGNARSVRDVFKRFLVRNKPGYVPGQWTTLESALGWITAAGGVAVVAHPARYKMTRSKLLRMLGEFRECGGVGMEVVSGSHSKDDMLNMAAVARATSMPASCGSDYHGPEKPWVELGSMAALPDGCAPVWSSPQWAAATRA